MNRESIWASSSPEEEERYKKILEDRRENSPFYSHMTLEVTGLGQGWATFRMPIGEHLLNSGGIVHGGAVCSIADAAAGVALATLLDKDLEKPVTVELKLNFIAPAKEGELTAKGTVVHKGKIIATTEVEVYNKERLVAKGISTFLVMRTS
ncbi:MAG: PaaI family thioesterase [Actinomycetota bacterium]|nr:PaaI family thioesterase [Actinomycetota bacterium]